MYNGGTIFLGTKLRLPITVEASGNAIGQEQFIIIYVLVKIFDFVPVLWSIYACNNPLTGMVLTNFIPVENSSEFLWNCATANGMKTSDNIVSITYSNKQVEWYAVSPANATTQLNSDGITFYWMAIN